ncbi:hypothetical protein [Streptomyces flavofungini]|uniref:hypothetical protein n=1 Tax=Streptomyces flavofungini TaxID=68200 RepID=UPI0025B0DD4F|nr:hypothetical protein [Streptomyces flavofungini]WJV47655.1 hypothetical protein QUY26_20275 [Streptomyces flavofungini]
MNARRPEPPPARDLSYEQYSGRACVWCGAQLTSGAVAAGISRGKIGAVVLDIGVYACPLHANGPGVALDREA